MTFPSSCHTCHTVATPLPDLETHEAKGFATPATPIRRAYACSWLLSLISLSSFRCVRSGRSGNSLWFLGFRLTDLAVSGVVGLAPSILGSSWSFPLCGLIDCGISLGSGGLNRFISGAQSGHGFKVMA